MEQILASHARVLAAGERMDFQEAVTDVMGMGDRSRLPDFASDLTPETLRQIGSAYLDSLDHVERIAHASAAINGGRGGYVERITDKLPGNFLFVGLIHLVFPNAPIIHTFRDPVDTCLSCFSRLFANNQQPQTYELGELGRYYRAYANLMAHWRKVLPEGTLLEVNYGDLVDNFEGEARRIVKFCGLDWDRACLEFYRTQRPVRTASMAQVRQPIYRTSLHRRRPDAETLRPLLVGLGLE